MAGGIAEFYKTVFDLATQVSPDGTECVVMFNACAGGDTPRLGGDGGGDSDLPSHKQVLVFRESADAKPRDNYERTDAARCVLCALCASVSYTHLTLPTIYSV